MSPPRHYNRNSADALAYTRGGMFCVVVLYGALAGVVSGYVPVWIVAPVIAVSYARWALYIHELMHVHRPEYVRWILRSMMLFDTPLSLGYREYQDVHFRHHRLLGTPKDPEAFQIDGSASRAFIGAMLSPEIAAYKWVRAHGVSPSLARDGLIRACGMALLVALAPQAFWGYWITLRSTIGVSNFLFHRMLHCRRGKFGTFELRLSGVPQTLLRSWLGKELIHVLCEHDAHHAWPSVKPGHLPVLLIDYPTACK